MKKFKKAALLSLLLFILCMGTACTNGNNKDKNDMAGNTGNGNGNTTNTTANGNEEPRSEVASSENTQAGTEQGVLNDADGNGVGNEAGGIVDDAGNTVGNVIDDVGNGVENVAEDVGNGVKDITR